MRITKISVFPPDLIEVLTDTGLAGYGAGSLCQQTLRRNPGMVIGRAPFEVESIFDELSSLGATAGGLDIALWDLMGKAMGKPVCRILGKPYRGQVPACPSVPDTAHAARHKIIRVEAPIDLRRAGTRVGLRFTARDTEEALVLGAKLQESCLEFWESPIPGDNPEGYARLRDVLRISLAAGPDIPLDALIKNYVQTGLVDMAVQDVGVCGLTGLRRLSYFCWLFHVRLAPCCTGAQLGIAAAVHGAACIPPASNAIAAPPVFVISGGLPEVELTVPSCPGLGVRIERPSCSPSFVLGDGK
ncbi:MAG: hypothetical protein IT164_06125 [Bryobacterales bacterium]|nr:hypothetical protein [Bryobacterales bacterium]